MSAPDLLPRTAAADRASLGAVLGARNTWLFFALGFGAGIPATWGWITLFPRIDIPLGRTPFLVLMSFGVVSLVQLAAAPFLDRYRAPLFRRLGHRRSWAATAAAAAFVLIAIHIAVALASAAAQIHFEAISGVLAFPAAALLWIAIDALRIEAQPGRAQAVALTAQLAGALATTATVGRFAGEAITLPLALAFAAMMALAFGAVLLIEEPRRAESSPAPESIRARLARPWRMFFARHGASAGFLLAAIAAYALAGSAADFLGRQGYLIETFVAQGVGFDPAHRRVVEVMATQEVVLMLIGAAAGLLIAFRVPPGRALALSASAWLAVSALFVLCKVALGFTVFTVAGLFALGALIAGASYIMVWTVAARLTAPPDTAGQFAVLAFLLSLFSVSGDFFRVMSAAIGGYGIVAVAAVAAVAAIVLIRIAARRARRPG